MDLQSQAAAAVTAAASDMGLPPEMAAMLGHSMAADASSCSYSPSPVPVPLSVDSLKLSPGSAAAIATAARAAPAPAATTVTTSTNAAHNQGSGETSEAADFEGGCAIACCPSSGRFVEERFSERHQSFLQVASLSDAVDALLAGRAGFAFLPVEVPEASSLALLCQLLRKKSRQQGQADPVEASHVDPDISDLCIADEVAVAETFLMVVPARSASPSTAVVDKIDVPSAAAVQVVVGSEEAIAGCLGTLPSHIECRTVASSWEAVEQARRCSNSESGLVAALVPTRSQAKQNLTDLLIVLSVKSSRLCRSLVIGRSVSDTLGGGGAFGSSASRPQAAPASASTASTSTSVSTSTSDPLQLHWLLLTSNNERLSVGSILAKVLPLCEHSKAEVEGVHVLDRRTMEAASLLLEVRMPRAGWAGERSPKPIRKLLHDIRNLCDATFKSVMLLL